MLPLEDAGDRLIAIRNPAHVVRHPAKVCWFIHHHRGLFDLWGTRFQGVRDTPETRAYREVLRSADIVGLSEARSRYTNSQVVADRIRRFDALDATPLYPPVGGAVHLMRCDDYGDFILYPSRVTEHKRQLLAMRAIARCRTPVRLVIAGVPDGPTYERVLRRAARELGIEERVELRLHWVSEEEKRDLLARCLAVAYLPLDEDSYGYPSLEAHHSHKAVVSCTDSGGTLELIEPGRNGYLCDPHADDLARAFDELYEDRSLAQRMGEAGPARMHELGINWDHTIERLLA